ncbi:helix-turn-helix transcriptional regulator [Mycobacterium intracellulare]|uniref:response regulator transcription factor n=1 Tax=Mycobacterium intracellulare TaxID=1767 RepID=UPI001E1525F3|nr:helix-turn-helix transcriptional regulator [Mycobacterium intracellulare]MCA2272424.1 helix-turn-helix transcriptional regulator [Mycobacterium intracellulare]MCA2324838.1 helix-turn-helix transcriptional regulator [Mycobacterium intracellulare]
MSCLSSRLDRRDETSDSGPTRPELTAREREILLAWLRNDSKDRVARALYISAGTVSTHLQRIRAKYAVVGRPATTKAALVVRAIQDGLIDVDDL